jgi:putative ABC transport system ATP-binding protein
MLRFADVGKAYTQGAVTHQALDGVTFTIDPGEFAVVTGKSGSGKSTLLNLMTGVDRPSTGQVVVAGRDITGLGEADLCRWRGAHVGIVFQFFQLIPTLSVVENLLLPMDLVGKIPAPARTARAHDLLATVGLAGHAAKLPGQLSGGEQQRVAIARALANDAGLLVADEPTGNLDSKNADAIFALLGDLNAAGTTVVMVTHEREPLPAATRLIRLQDGRVVDDRPVAAPTTGGRS